MTPAVNSLKKKSLIVLIAIAITEGKYGGQGIVALILLDMATVGPR